MTAAAPVLPLAGFARLAPALSVRVIAGLATAIDAVAAAAAADDDARFLTHGWFVAAIRAYGGHPRPLLTSGAGGGAGAGRLVAALGQRRLAAVRG